MIEPCEWIPEEISKKAKKIYDECVASGDKEAEDKRFSLKQELKKGDKTWSYDNGYLESAMILYELERIHSNERPSREWSDKDRYFKATIAAVNYGDCENIFLFSPYVGTLRNATKKERERYIDKTRRINSFLFVQKYASFIDQNSTYIVPDYRINMLFGSLLILDLLTIYLTKTITYEIGEVIDKKAVSITIKLEDNK